MNKILLLLLLLTANTTCFSSEEILQIEKSIIDKAQTEFDDFDEIGEFGMKNIMKCLKHPYFEDRFTNFKKILGIGSFGVAIEADFRLFKERPQTLPVALKVNYESRHLDKFEMLRNYLSLMVNPADVKIEGGEEDDLKVYNLSQHFEKMRSGDDSIKKDAPFVNMLYEAAVITVHPEDDMDIPPKKLTITVVQLGFSSLEKDFLEHPQESEEILNRNSRNVSKLIVETSYGLWRIHANGFFHGDLKENNIIVTGTKDDFHPMIIDFDCLKSRKDLLQMTTPLEKGIFNKAYIDYPNYVKYSENPNYLIGNWKVMNYLFIIKEIPVDAVSDVELKEAYKNEVFCVCNINVLVETIKFIRLSLKLIKEYIKGNLIRADHPNIINLTTELESLKSSWEKGTEYFTSKQLVNVLNEASSLGFTSFTSVNADLDRFFEEIEASMNASSSTQVKNVQEKPGNSKDELKDVLIV
jgi:serine/threonine protein kinase